MKKLECCSLFLFGRWQHTSLHQDFCRACTFGFPAAQLHLALVVHNEHDGVEQAEEANEAVCVITRVQHPGPVHHVLELEAHLRNRHPLDGQPPLRLRGAALPCTTAQSMLSINLVPACYARLLADATQRAGGRQCSPRLGRDKLQSHIMCPTDCLHVLALSQGPVTACRAVDP